MSYIYRQLVAVRTNVFRCMRTNSVYEHTLLLTTAPVQDPSRDPDRGECHEFGTVLRSASEIGRDSADWRVRPTYTCTYVHV